jgi:Integrase zinc binding domain
VGLPTFTLEVDAKYIKGMLNNPDIQPNNTMNHWIAGILLFNLELVHVPGKNHVGPDSLSRRSSTPEEEEEPQDDWADEVLGLGVWVNSWLKGQALEKAKSTLPHFQQSIGYPTRGQVLMPANAILQGAIKDQDEQPSLQTAALLPLFITFTLHPEPAAGAHVTIPHSAADSIADLELPRIKELLDPTQKPADLNEATFKRFIRHATRFVICSSQLWQWASSKFHQLVIFLPEEQLSFLRQAHDRLGHKGFFSTHCTLTDCFWWPGID